MAKGKVIFQEDLCKGCNLCVTVCPTDVIALDNVSLNAKGYHPAGVANADKCIACMNCALICPDLVITVEKFDK
jgi:2-oxoglutarate ferredoxin oxidoreductase subunit delta